MPDRTTPYTNTSYLNDELGFLAIRAKRVACERSHRERSLDQGAPSEGMIGEVEGVAQDEVVRHIAALRERENAMRSSIDERLSVTRQGRGTLGLDSLCQRYALNEQERTALLLGLAPAVGSEAAATAVGEVIGSHYQTPTCEVLAAHLDLHGVERLGCLDLFKPTSPLIAHGLIALDFGYRAASKTTENTWDARFILTTKALRLMVGQDPDAA